MYSHCIGYLPAQADLKSSARSQSSSSCGVISRQHRMLCDHVASEHVATSLPCAGFPAARLPGAYPLALEFNFLFQAGASMAFDRPNSEGTISDALQAATEIYETEILSKQCNLWLVDAIIEFVKADPASSHSYFEIGSGTGGTASFVLPVLNPWTTTYYFSDLSNSFLRNARSRFSASYPFLTYALFNAESPAGAQGYATNIIDAVLATNVIHATEHLGVTIGTVSALLRPARQLLFNEVHASSFPEDLTFGLTDGWWRLTDIEHRGEYPVIHIGQWTSLFNACGYTNSNHTQDKWVTIDQAVLVAFKADDPIEVQCHLQPCTKARNSNQCITGGLGGLGVLMARLWVQSGARNIILLSRRDHVPCESAGDWNSSKSSCANIVRKRVNAAECVSLCVTLRDSVDHPPVTGIVHGAGVLRDGMITQQTRRKYAEVYQPKYYGSLYLHQGTANKSSNIFQFVLFSSVAAIFGNPGQSNHSAANSSLDALATFRGGMGNCGTSINLGLIGAVGYAARFSGSAHSVGHSVEVPLEHTVHTFEMVISNAPASIILATIPQSHVVKTGADLDPLFVGLAARFKAQLGQAMTRNVQLASD